MNISYGCEELISELNEDIEEFGESQEYMVWARDIDGTTIYINYDFADESFRHTELEEGEYLMKMTAKTLLPLLISQNQII